MNKSVGMTLWDAEVTLSESAKQHHNAESITSVYNDHALDLTLFVSCYNEEPYIHTTFETIREVMSSLQFTYEIIAIDDVSKDNTVAVVEAYIAAHPEMNIVLRKNKVNKGLAQNYFDAAFLGKGKYYRLICGDNSEPVSSIRKVLEHIGQADILVPYYETSEGKNWKRMLISKTFTTIVNTITGYKFHYYNGLAVHLRFNVMRWHPNTRGFGFQADILCLLLDLGFSFKEIPITMIEQRKGNSNALTLKNFLSVAHTIVDIVIRRVSNRVYKWK